MSAVCVLPVVAVSDAVAPGLAPASEPMSAFALGRRSLVYALGGLAYKGVALLVVPILARLLTPAQLGLLDLAAVLATIVGLAAALGSDQGAAYLEPRADDDAGVWASTLAIIGTISAAALIGVALVARPMAELLTGDPANGVLVIAAALYGGVVALTTTALNAIRLHGTPRSYAVASFAIVSVEMGAALVIAWAFEFPVILMILAWAGGALLVVVPLLLRYVPRFGRPRMATVRRLAAFGMPLLPAAMAWLVGDAWIRATLAREVELGALGEYGIGYRIASVIALGVTGFGVAWQPYIYRSPSGAVAERATGMLTYLVLALGALSVALTALAPEVIAVVAGESYAGATAVVAPLSAGAVALGAFVLVAAVVGASGSTRRVAVAALMGLAVQLLAAGPLIEPIGLAGAGLASLAGYLVAVAVLLVGERNLISGRGGATLMMAAVVVAAGLALAAASLDSGLLSRGALAVGFAATAAASAMVARAVHRGGRS